MTVRETALRAVETVLQTVSGATVKRNADRPAEVPLGGILVVQDGDPGEPEVSLSPLRYHYEHVAEIEVLVQVSPTTVRATKLDALVAAVGTALAADRTLGGAVDYSIPQAPIVDSGSADGANPVLGATIPLVLHYSTTDPLV